MKRNKLLHRITFYLILIFLATSCTQQTSSAPGSGGINASGNSFLGIPLPENKYGDFKLVYEPSYVTTTGGIYDVESIFPGSASILYTDFETEKTIYLCNQPGCKHNTDACTSYIALKDEYEYPPHAVVIENMLLLIHSGSPEESNPYIEIRNLDGSDSRMLCEFPEDRGFDFYWISDGNYLFVTMDVVDESGNVHYYLSEINLSTGEIKDVFDATTESGFYQLVAGYKNHLILEEASFDMDVDTTRIFLFNPEDPSLDTEIGRCVLDDDYIFIADERMISYDSAVSEVVATDPQTGEEKTVSLEKDKNQISSYVFPAFDDYILYTQLVPDAEGEVVVNAYLVDLETGRAHLLTLKTTTFKQYHWTVVGTYEDKLCVIYDYKEVPLVFETEEGDIDTIETYMDLYGFISKEDYIANRPNMRPAQSAI